MGLLWGGFPAPERDIRGVGVLSAWGQRCWFPFPGVKPCDRVDQEMCTGYLWCPKSGSPLAPAPLPLSLHSWGGIKEGWSWGGCQELSEPCWLQKARKHREKWFGLRPTGETWSFLGPSRAWTVLVHPKPGAPSPLLPLPPARSWVSLPALSQLGKTWACPRMRQPSPDTPGKAPREVAAPLHEVLSGAERWGCRRRSSPCRLPLPPKLGGKGK